MMIDYPTACAYVLWKTGDDRLGMEPGSFVSKLLDAWMAADPSNHELLSSAWPALGVAVHVYKNVPHGQNLLKMAAATIGETR